MTDYAQKIVDKVAEDIKKQKEEGKKILQDMEKDPNIIK